MKHRSIRLVTGLLTVLVMLAGAGCTGGSAPDAEPSGSTGGSASTTPSSRPQAASVPLQAQVTHVAGRLGAARRQALVARVARTVSSYVDGAFLAGSYPRSDFAAAFTTFTKGAARRAKRDVALLTDQPLGSTTRSVRATRRTAYLSVLAPDQHVAGVTAAVDLEFVVDRGEHPGQRVRLRGRLLLTHTGAGWRIFGYDLRRTQTPATGGSR